MPHGCQMPDRNGAVGFRERCTGGERGRDGEKVGREQTNGSGWDLDSFSTSFFVVRWVPSPRLLFHEFFSPHSGSFSIYNREKESDKGRKRKIEDRSKVKNGEENKSFLVLFSSRSVSTASNILPLTLKDFF